MSEEWRTITDALARSSVDDGFDLVQPLQVGWYNDAVEPAYRLPDGGRRDALAVLVANTRALWPRFLAALRATPALLADADPLDRYTVRCLRAACAGLRGVREIRFAHERAPRRVAMQRLAHVAGLAYLSPSWLSVHPVYGPWIGLRAVAVFDAAGPPGPASTLADPCPQCGTDCGPLLERARTTLGAPGRTAISANWRLWLAVRDACPVGRAHRYSDDQIEYHYTWDRAVLERATGSVL